MVKMFFGLPFLPEHEISNAFVRIIYLPPNDDFSEFDRYYLQNYI